MWYRNRSIKYITPAGLGYCMRQCDREVWWLKKKDKKKKNTQKK